MQAERLKYIRAVQADRTPKTAVRDPREESPAGPAAAQGQVGVWLRYAFEPGEQRGAELGNPLFELLAAVIEGGSIRHAAQVLGTSYRHVWGSLRRWEETLGEPLITWSQGRKARPTELAQRLLWAERRARTRMQPHIEALRADLGRVLADARDERHQVLNVRASHDLALPVLQQHLAESASLHLSIGFQGSVDALRALNDGQCLVAGFHVPVLESAAPVFARALKPLLKRKSHRLIACSRRVQGLMVRKEHAGRVRSLSDVIAGGLRFVNRQPGSGTRLLVDHLMQQHGVHGLSWEHVENTHVAVALCVASGVADAGIGVEAAALQFGLHFAPVIEECYFLACLRPDHAAVQRLRDVLAGERWRQILENLPGYRPAVRPGALMAIEEALPGWRRTRSTAARRPARHPA
jgi:putative molybdopterin biosynthesis protein